MDSKFLSTLFDAFLTAANVVWGLEAMQVHSVWAYVWFTFAFLFLVNWIKR